MTMMSKARIADLRHAMGDGRMFRVSQIARGTFNGAVWTDCPHIAPTEYDFDELLDEIEQRQEHVERLNQSITVWMTIDGEKNQFIAEVQVALETLNAKTFGVPNESD